MKKMANTALVALGFASALVFASGSAEARDSIKHTLAASQAPLTNEIVLENFGAFDQVITVYDQKCDEVAYSNLFVAAGSQVPVELCRDSFSGYSSFVVDRVNAESGNPIGPLHFGLVSDGEKKTF